MSLQVWLPLNGNLNNQGLSNVTSTGGTVNDAGILGKCYACTSSSYITIQNPVTDKYDFSFSFWMKIPTTFSSVGAWNTMFLFRTLNKNGDSTETSVAIDWTDYNNIKIYDDAYHQNIWMSPGDQFNYDKWCHYTITHSGDDSSTKIKVYTDGILRGEFSNPNRLVLRSGDILLGHGINPSYGPIYFNDFRLYDHCLSAKEVKEISKGLNLHYKLSDPYIEPTTNYSSQSTGSSGWNNSGSSSRSNDDTSVNRVFSTCPVLSIQQTVAGNSAMTFGTVNTSTYTALKGATVTASVYTYISDVNCSSSVIYLRSTVNNNKEGDEICAFRYKGSANPQSWPKNQWIRIEGTGTIASDETAVYFCTYTNNLNEKRYFTCWQLELKDHSTPFINGSRDESVVYDCSGIANNGTKIGGVLPSSNPLPIRYESCYDFDGNTGSIQIPNLATLVPNGEFTMNCWIYHDNTWSSKGYETIFGGPSGFELEAKNTSTNAPVLHARSWGKGEATYELNKWNMITMTRNASESKFYINGELKITGSAGTIPSGNYFIGAWNTSSQQNYKGKISDFRLYSNVLSVDDIKELYNTSASVDKNGNMYAYEFKEE